MLAHQPELIPPSASISFRSSLLFRTEHVTRIRLAVRRSSASDLHHSKALDGQIRALYPVRGSESTLDFFLLSESS